MAGMTPLARTTLVAAVALMLSVATPATASSPPVAGFQTYTETLPVAPTEALAALRAALPEDYPVTERPDGTVFVAYSGVEMPGGLAAFLTDSLDTLDPAQFAPGAFVNVSIALQPTPGGTALRLMMPGGSVADTPAAFRQAFGGNLPATASILMNEEGGDCSGQIVLSESVAPDMAARTYAARLEAQGFTVTGTPEPDGTLLMAEAGACAVFVFIQPDRDVPTRSTIVVRYLED